SALNYVSNPTFEVDTGGWAVGSDASTSFAQSSVRAWQGSRSMLITWGGSLNSNPTFETALSPWTGNGATVARVNTVAQSGTCPAPAGAAFGQIAATVPSTPPATDILFVDEVRFLRSTGGQFPAVQTVITGLVIGQQYTASAYVWVPSGARAVGLFVVGISGA